MTTYKKRNLYSRHHSAKSSKRVRPRHQTLSSKCRPSVSGGYTASDVCQLVGIRHTPSAMVDLYGRINRGELPEPCHRRPDRWNKETIDDWCQRRRERFNAMISAAGSGDPDCWRGNLLPNSRGEFQTGGRGSSTANGLIRQQLQAQVDAIDRPLSYELTISFPREANSAQWGDDDARRFNENHASVLLQLTRQLDTEAWRSLGMRRIPTDEYQFLIVPEMETKFGTHCRWHWHILLFFNESELEKFIHYRPAILRRLKRHLAKRVAKADIEYQPVDSCFSEYAFKRSYSLIEHIVTNIPSFSLNK